MSDPSLVYVLGRFEEKLDRVLSYQMRILRALNVIIQEDQEMAAQLDSLKANVEQNTNVTQSAVTLLQGLKQQLDSAIASGDMTQVQALSDQLGTDTHKLADAVTANTPAAGGGGGGTPGAGGGGGAPQPTNPTAPGQTRSTGPGRRQTP